MVSQKKSNFKELIYIGVGTNLGDRLGNIRHAIEELNQFDIQIIRTASVYETPAWGFESDDLFLNTVFECSSPIKPMDCLKATQFVEKKIGRKKTLKEGYESRIIDLDILLFKDQQIYLPELTIPHTYITERQFVITPMHELTDSFFFDSLNSNFEELKNKFKNSDFPFVVYNPPLVKQ
ncbi:MAG: 2-amino-4-hydroxy-6-hydroxymethyldihydropteridine pyrophosphokinae [Fluviicola sp.]|jgi:2-amino-4-hydroxy-6-hydroxymethyldihydropteridine diphosphokinase|uniref:2-amino-4-hydroxy-6- hydroxymethyldihydropteridine diphosphokinase n=1 Tax=Fluviicola sp. TaxID=1917219 RepID=UPI0026099469|nr:2-amino-4-hydroxy-6-hydroxymethyldihydropteridine diphosphokinase [Fluviicola sp.]MDF3029117.1 2-amino-4-hydroxy-6-hydroxymethyldihydropteridine pyrophosphokinae [Fluviicola sp.]